MTLETKAIDPEINLAFDRFLATFEAFKEANDARLDALEKRGGDILNEEKVARIDRALDEQKQRLDRMLVNAARPHLGGDAKAYDVAAGERKAAFVRYMRKGDASLTGAIETKALSAGSNPDGGYVVPLEIESSIDRILAKASPMRALSEVRQMSASVFRKPITSVGAQSGWTAESNMPSQTATPTISAIDVPAMELYAMPAATQTLLDDALVDIEQWLAHEVQIVFAEQEGAAFINGDGDAKPTGILSYANVPDANHSWGKLGYIISGANGAFADSNPVDTLVMLAYAPRQGYRANATWLMNRKTESVIRSFKDNQGRYIWQPAASVGQPATLLGYPVAEADDMPDIANGSLSIAFGDFSRGYLIVDRVGIRVLRDPFTVKPYVLFYTTKRVGGAVQNFEAIKLMKFAAS